jgi:hypothetical protein
MDATAVTETTRRWIESIVIGLNLCPFAQRVFRGDLVRYVVSDATDEDELLRDLERELKTLAAAPIESIETTLLIHPRAMANVLDYNDFLDPAEALIERLELEGVIQIASFHPHYQFAGTAADAVENYTNRSPYPMLHLLREESITQVAGDAAELDEIPRRNVETLRKLGRDRIVAMLKAIAHPGSLQ